MVGGYQCECHEGFAGNGRACDPIDHCNNPELNECDNNAKCINTDGTYDCECNTGFRGTGRRCININECQERTHAKDFIPVYCLIVSGWSRQTKYATHVKIVICTPIAMIVMVTSTVNALLALKVMVRYAMI